MLYGRGTDLLAAKASSVEGLVVLVVGAGRRVADDGVEDMVMDEEVGRQRSADGGNTVSAGPLDAGWGAGRGPSVPRCARAGGKLRQERWSRRSVDQSPARRRRIQPRSSQTTRRDAPLVDARSRNVDPAAARPPRERGSNHL